MFLESGKSAREYLKQEFALYESFASGTASKVMEKLTNYLSKKIGKRIYITPKATNYQNNYGKFSGYYALIGDGNTAFRINFLLGKSDYISSIDYFDKISNTPTLTVEFEKSDNIVEIANSIESILKGDYTLSESYLKERKSFALDVVKKWVSQDEKYYLDLLQNERFSTLFRDYFENWIDSEGERPLSFASFSNNAKEILKDKKLTNRYAKTGIVKKGSTEKVIVDKKEENKFDKEFQLTVDEKYEQIDGFVDLLSNGFSNGFIITGSPGIGKTHTVLERLKKVGLKYEYTSGAIKSAKDLYKHLYYHKDGEILIYDDVDDVLINKQSQNLLKAILDTNTNKENEVTFFDKDFKAPEEIALMGSKMKEKAIPNSFFFTSGIIFISNLPKRKINSAVMSRSLNVDLELTKDEILDRIASKISEFPPQVPTDIKLEALDFIRSLKDKIKNIDFRLFDKVATLRMTNHPSWTKWAYSQVVG